MLRRHGVLPLTEANVLGVLSLIFWSLFTIVTLKYVVVILRADNRGEGGILALTTLAQRNCCRGRATLVLACRRRAVLRRRHDHARDLRAERGRGARGGPAAVQPYVVPFALVILAALFSCRAGHRRHWSTIRTGDVSLVHHARPPGPRQIIRAPGSAGAQSVVCSRSVRERISGWRSPARRVFLAVTGGEAL